MEEREMSTEVFAKDSELGLTLPADVARRYHLAPGVRVEISQIEEGILLVPVDVAPWFSPEWERALDFVVDRYRDALEVLGE